VKSPYRNAE